MRAFANFILRGRLQALLVVTAGAVLTMILPIFNHVSGGALALATLRNGFREGLFLAAGAALVLGLVAYLSALGPTRIQFVLIAMGLMVWLPALVSAQVLRTTRSMGNALAAAGAVSALAVIGFHLAVGDVIAWWQEVMQQVLIPMLKQAATGFGADELDKLVDTLSKVMTGILGATVLFTAMTNLFIGRWLQAIVFNPGGFRQEFHSLYLGRWMAVMALVLLAFVNLASGTLGRISLDLLFLAGAVYSLQGLSLLHAIVAMTNAHIAWLVGVYGLMLFALPQMVLVLSAAGFVDSLMNFRARLQKKGGTPPGQDAPPPGPDTTT